MFLRKVLDCQGKEVVVVRLKPDPLLFSQSDAYGCINVPPVRGLGIPAKIASPQPSFRVLTMRYVRLGPAS